VVGNQIGNLIIDFSLDLNLCFKYPNGSCEPILNIYFSKKIQWYMELFDPKSFEPYNCFLKIWESIGYHNPSLGLVKVQAKNEARESHLMLLGV
jgi:hypothetical protein